MQMYMHMHIHVHICTHAYAHPHPLTQPKVITLDVTREWPPVTSCAFSHNLTSLSYQGPSVAATASAAGSGDGAREIVSQPKGVMLFANIGIPGYVCPI